MREPAAGSTPRPATASPEADPVVSVIVASYNARHTIGATLDSLRRQDAGVPYEVIVVDSSDDGTGELVSRDHPEVRLLACAERRFPGDARNLGERQARGDILVFTDADCVADPGFIRAIVGAHRAAAGGRGRSPVIGGVIANANRESRVGWGHYFAACSQWMPQREPRAATEIPSACLSVKRWAFRRYGPFLEGVYCSDTAFNWQVRRGGHEPWFEPAIRVAHTNITHLGQLLRKQAFHGRSFARVRMGPGGFGPVHRCLYVLGSPLLPFVLFARTAARVVRAGAYRRDFARTFPVVFLSLAAWSWGEAAGYVGGPLRPVALESRKEPL